MLWLATTLVGQAAFLYYIAAFYGVTTLTGDFESWTTNAMVSRSYVAGDAMGNLYFAAHVLLAGVVALGERCNSCRRSRTGSQRFTAGTAESS